jgi:hypothetical protein
MACATALVKIKLPGARQMALMKVLGRQRLEQFQCFSVGER